jgi:Predicted AAA-ATPase
MAINIPYGIGNFESLVTQDYYYVDRTQYIELIEASKERHIAFLRPRRFGKSLFVNTLKDYYDIQKQPKFETIFGNCYIGKNPTPLANTYMILSFDFSGILTDTAEKAHQSFLQSVKISVNSFLYAYFPSQYEEIETTINRQKEAIEVMKVLFSFVDNHKSDNKMYITIDEYDHFANELISFNLEIFKAVVSRNGWVRKFYETIKIATGQGVVDRIFITGVSPITLDSLTSGFNIVKQLSGDEFARIDGFYIRRS